MDPLLDWTRAATAYVGEYERTKRPPKKYSQSTRLIQCGACLVCLGFTRLIAGLCGLCASETCGKSEGCFTYWMSAVYTDVDVPALYLHLKDPSNEEIEGLLLLIEILLRVFTPDLETYETLHYDIVDKVVIPLIKLSPVQPTEVVPSSVRWNLLRFLEHLEAMEHRMCADVSISGEFI